MSRPLVVTIAFIIVAILGGASSAAAAGPPFELSVTRDRLIGGSKGTLVFEWDRVE